MIAFDKVTPENPPKETKAIYFQCSISSISAVNQVRSYLSQPFVFVCNSFNHDIFNQNQIITKWKKFQIED